ncbi:MAG: porin [Saprospiraceae bacterium]|nr:porin [Saprospiraceae bacterium]
MKFGLFILAVSLISNIFAQTDSVKKLTYSAYGEIYYSYDFSNPSNHKKSNFLYNHKRHNELNVNLLIVKANYVDKKYRANLGLMAGNYAKYNLISEPSWAQFIYEANIGLKLSERRNIWIDAGIMPSHIGFESAISADCWTLTRSLLAENSPYYEAGLKISYASANEKLLLSALFLNGWQRVRKPDFVQEPSFGMQASYRPSSRLTLNYSNFIGSDKPDSLESFRHFHNFYLQYEPSDRFGIIAGFDIGSEKILSNKFDSWYTPVIILRQRTSKNTVVAFRAEYYSDRNELIIASGTANGFQTFGLSTNFDFEVNDRLKCRIEGKMYNSKDKIFSNNTSNDNYSITTNLTIKLR